MSAAGRQPKHFIESLARGMKVLQAFSAERPRLTLPQLADLTGLNDDLDARIKSMKLAPLTSRAITDPQDLKEYLALIRARGFSISNRESSLAFFATAAPLVDRDGRVAAAVNISLPVIQTGGKELLGLVRGLLAQGRRCSTLLGYQGAYPWPGAAWDLKHLRL